MRSSRTILERSWSVILAGGEGERTRPLIENWLGYHKPKQYCTFVGRRSLFQHTVDRADRMASPDRRVVIFAEAHRSEVAGQLDKRPKGTVVFQPRNCGTAPGVFLALTYVKAQDPDAIVTIFPSDHFVYPEQRLAEAVASAREVAAGMEGSLVLLGARPDGPETEYGWIEPGIVRGRVGGFAAREVGGFVEKPSEVKARRALRAGALWNTLIVTGELTAFWKLGFEFLPEMMVLFEELSGSVGTEEEQLCLNEIYRRMPIRDFSSDVLESAQEKLIVLELSGITWSDWGRPERIRDSLRALGKKPSCPIRCEEDEDASSLFQPEAFAASMSQEEVEYGIEEVYEGRQGRAGSRWASKV